MVKILTHHFTAFLILMQVLHTRIMKALTDSVLINVAHVNLISCVMHELLQLYTSSLPVSSFKGWCWRGSKCIVFSKDVFTE